MKSILLFFPVLYLLLSTGTSTAQVNNPSVTIVRDAEGIHAGPYSFGKDQLDKKRAWKGQWIWLNRERFPDRQRTSSTWISPAGSSFYRALFRKSWEITQIPARATLFLTADIRYRVYLNGVPVGEGPPNTGGDYGDTVSPKYWYYSALDLRGKLHKGRNVLAVEVFAWALESSDVTSSFGRLLAELQDGEKTLVKTDTSWKAVADTSYRYMDGFLQYDAANSSRLQKTNASGAGQSDASELSHSDAPTVADWKANSFVDRQWPAVSLQHAGDPPRLYQSNIPVCMEYPVKPVRSFAVVDSPDPMGKEMDLDKFYSPQSGGARYILDFGKNMPAHISLDLTAHGGDTVELVSYEKMGPDPGTGRKYRYICREGFNSFRTPSVSPFRMLGVRIATRQGLTIRHLEAGFTTYPVQYKGAFHCSDSFYTRLWSIVRYTTQLCMSDLFFDSPMHQEPIGCTGDYFIESMNSYYAFGDYWLTRQNLIQTAQLMEKNDFRMFHTSYSLLWVQMLRQYVQFTGDTALVRELLPIADRLMERFRRYLNKEGLVTDAPNYMFMDWITIRGYNAHHPPAMIGMGYMSALLYKAMKDVDELRRMTVLTLPVAAGGIARRDISLPRYAVTADSIRAAMNSLLWDPARGLYRDGIPFTTKVAPNEWMPADSNLITYSAHVNTLAVLYDIAPPESREAILNYVVTQKEYELQPYFMSYVLGAAQKLGWKDKGLQLIDRWQTGIDTATYTLKENWRDKTDFGYGGDYSHAWGGAPLRWLSANVLGISPERPDYALIAIHPYTGHRLTWADGTVPVGRENKDMVSVQWKQSDGALEFAYVIPSGRSAYFYIPEGWKTHTWVMDAKVRSSTGPLLLSPGKHLIRCVIGDKMLSQGRE